MILKKKDILEELKGALPDYKAKEIENAYNFFWQEGVFQSISDLVHPRIFIPKLGTFNFVKSKIDNIIAKNNLRKETSTAFSSTDMETERLLEFKKIIEQDNIKNNKKREIKNELKKNLEK